MKKGVLFLTTFVFLAAHVYLLSNNILAAGRVEINTASLQQLDQITGVGPVLAQRIIDARPFSSVDDLLKVKGIGEKTLQKIKDQGLAYVADQLQQSTQEAAPTPTPVVSLTPTPSIIYPGGIFINEILPTPEGSDEINEWIEFYNANTFEVDLQGWKIQDTEGTTTDYIFPKETKMAALGYLVLKRPDTKITLNNEKDGLNLISPDGKIVNSVSFEKAPKNQSYAKTALGWTWNPNLTPGAGNIILTKTDKTTSSRANLTTGQALLSSQKIDNSIGSKNFTADVVGATNIDDSLNTSNPWFLFLIAIAITVISATIILLVKLKLKK